MWRTWNPEAGMGYLTLSVFAQSIVERLVRPGEESTEERERFFAEAIHIFESANSSERMSASLSSGLRPLREFGQVSALYDVLAPTAQEAQEKLKDVVKFLEEFKQDPKSVPNQKREEFLGLFDSLADKALYRSRRPVEEVPPGIQELCRQT